MHTAMLFFSSNYFVLHHFHIASILAMASYPAGIQLSSLTASYLIKMGSNILPYLSRSKKETYYYEGDLLLSEYYS